MTSALLTIKKNELLTNSKIDIYFNKNYKMIKKANKCLFIITVLFLFFRINIVAQTSKKSLVSSSKLNKTTTSNFITIDEAIASLKIPEAAAKLVTNLGNSPEFPYSFRPQYKSVEPIKLFDNFYFVGTTAVGAFIIDTGDGLVMLDTGCGDTDVAMMVSDMKKLGHNPSKIRLILLSHEHFDHYGGVQYLKKNVCPEAKVAMSLIGWNMLQTVSLEGPYIGTRPQSVDIYLTDGMKIKVGNTTFQIVSTPGHSPGCLSFIIPVIDNNEPHMVGIMGGAAVQPTQAETKLYKASIEYFKAFATDAKCDVGLYIHSQENTFASLRIRKPNEANPLIIGRESFDSVYLKSFRDRYQKMIDSGELKPY
jgi:metallo-beta-lactamase class B